MMETNRELEHTLIKQAQNGDSKAFDSLINATDGKLRGYLLSRANIKNESDLKDILQTTYLKAWRFLSCFKEDCLFYTWIARIGYNCAIDFFRKQKKESALSIDEMMENQENYAQFEHKMLVTNDNRKPITGLDAAYIRRGIDTMKLRLTKEHRRVFELVYEQEMPYRQVAKIMKCPVGTIMSRAFYTRHYAQKYLRNILSDAVAA